jgi:uncharacterized membrane protein YphA (DoxX/SURF4 family)
VKPIAGHRPKLLGLAAIFIGHGIFKIIADRRVLPEDLSISAQIAVGWTEIICGVALAIGLLGRLAALVMIVFQIVAIVRVTGSQALMGPTIRWWWVDYLRVGPEYNLLLIAVCLAVILLGSGAASVDHLLVRMWQRKKARAGLPQPVAAGPGAGSALGAP